MNILQVIKESATRTAFRMRVAVRLRRVARSAARWNISTDRSNGFYVTSGMLVFNFSPIYWWAHVLRWPLRHQVVVWQGLAAAEEAIAERERSAAARDRAACEQLSALLAEDSRDPKDELLRAADGG